MSLFLTEVVTPPAHLPVAVAAADEALAAAVTEELERVVLWRGIVSQTRRITVDGPLPARIEIEPVASLTITRWTPTDDAEVIDAASYNFVSRDPLGTIIAPAPGYDWPSPQRSLDSFRMTYACGWQVSPESAPGAGDAVNNVPPSILLMIERAIVFREGPIGLQAIKTGPLDMPISAAYQTDRLPAAIQSIARAWNYRPGIFAA